MPRDYVKELFQGVQRKRTQTSTHTRYRMITSQKKVQKPSSFAYCPCITKHFMNDKEKEREGKQKRITSAISSLLNTFVNYLQTILLKHIVVMEHRIHLF